MGLIARCCFTRLINGNWSIFKGKSKNFPKLTYASIIDWRIHRISFRS
ncbi:hypothetical protein JOD41_001428 [Peptoniphilus gorbachii]|uniref:Uncharacterized protein n=1 Tax=Peptoniphilus gorbachii TaxID=411567 RepID=A0ABS2MKY4_9FIRM|nr:hypothetical protein [Peptoniphilus gorbachii]